MNRVLFFWALAGLALGLAWRDHASLIWALGVAPVLLALAVEIVRSLWRGEVGLDVLAALSMAAALAISETLAAAVVAVMYAGGTFLESFAEGRARAEMQALLARVPRSARRHGSEGLEEVALEAIRPGDRLLIRQGDTVPVDGRALAPALLDTAALTGEPLPQAVTEGGACLSGAVNAGEAFDLLAERPAADSTYAGILRLVKAAQEAKAPMARLADRWSLVFLVVSLGIAATAWGLTGDPARAVAVLVVATPCPLILAVPVAWVAGLSRAAQAGLMVKGAGALEAMARVRVLILDKTGTLTEGRPRIVACHLQDGGDADTLLRLAAGLEQASPHPVAAAIVAAAREAGLALAVPEAVREWPGEGLEGRVEGRQVILGGEGLVAGRVGAQLAQAEIPVGAVTVSVAVDGRPAGRLIMADPLRDGVPELLQRLRDEGLARLLLATGDRAEVAETLARGLPLQGVHAAMTPAAKRELVLAERAQGAVMMLGDGVNDAPALAAADVGVAMGARGAAASAEVADVVLLVDRLDPLPKGLRIARRARAIALQSVGAGIGLSLAGQVAAALGWLPPVQGALLQEAIDVAVILNALRALRIKV